MTKSKMIKRKQIVLYVSLLVIAIVFYVVSNGMALAYAKSITVSSINKVKTLSVESTTNTVREVTLGTTNPISSVTLKFKDAMSDKNISVTLKDINNDTLGSGTGSIGALPIDTISITLTDEVDSGERSNLAKITITIT